MNHARRDLAIKTVVATISGMAWALALGSWLCTFDWAWSLYHEMKRLFVALGVAGQGHCWLCGMSHAFRAIWQDRIAEAVVDNPHALGLFILMVALCASGIVLLNPVGRFRHAFGSGTTPPPREATATLRFCGSADSFDPHVPGQK
jgi:hypothetical protein